MTYTKTDIDTRTRGRWYGSQRFFSAKSTDHRRISGCDASARKWFLQTGLIFKPLNNRNRRLASMDANYLIEFGAKFGMFFVPFLFALCFHEFAHGFVAKMKGDRTAEILAGRLTLNPIPHIDHRSARWFFRLLAIISVSPFWLGKAGTGQ